MAPRALSDSSNKNENSSTLLNGIRNNSLLVMNGFLRIHVCSPADCGALLSGR